MINFFYDLNSLTQAILASMLAFLATSFGASFVYLIKKQNKRITDILLGMASGIMLAAAIFSLLLPANESSKFPLITIPLSIIFGSLFLILGDKVTNSKNNGFLLISSIILHNIPEGLSIGFAFGSITSPDMVLTALSLAIGIAIQNIPEGIAISLPLVNKGYSKHKAFFIGILSGIVEPISAIIGFLLVSKLTILLPVMLAFAAGSMIYVVIKELIPESQTTNSNLIAFITLLAFVFMMLLEI